MCDTRDAPVAMHGDIFTRDHKSDMFPRYTVNISFQSRPQHHFQGAGARWRPNSKWRGENGSDGGWPKTDTVYFSISDQGRAYFKEISILHTSDN